MSTQSKTVIPNDEILIQTKSRSQKNIKPSLQIYKPPGLRGVDYLSKKTSIHDSDQVSNANSGSCLFGLSNLTKHNNTEKPVVANLKNINNKKTNINNYTVVSSNSQQFIKTKYKCLVKPTIIKKQKIKQFTKKDEYEIALLLTNLCIVKEQRLINDFIAGGLIDEKLAHSLAKTLVQYVVEEKKQNARTVARICSILLNCPSSKEFQKGLINLIINYYERRDQLRSDNFKIWINFLNFISDLYASLGFTYEGGLLNILFNTFEYMLTKPILYSLKIEEFECIISSLLSVGYDLERNCPDQLSNLKNLIRDAFIEVQEPWARKMILLLIELGANSWNLLPDSNDYYFQ